MSLHKHYRKHVLSWAKNCKYKQFLAGFAGVCLATVLRFKKSNIDCQSQNANTLIKNNTNKPTTSIKVKKVTNLVNSFIITA